MITRINKLAKHVLLNSKRNIDEDMIIPITTNFTTNFVRNYSIYKRGYSAKKTKRIMKKLFLLMILIAVSSAVMSQIIPKYVSKDSLQTVENGTYLLKPTKVATTTGNRTFYFHEVAVLPHTYTLISIWVTKNGNSITYFQRKKMILREECVLIENLN
jgi:hypothetical protein